MMEAERQPVPIRVDGWIEAGLFALTMSVLNVSYAYGHQIGAHPVAFLVYAMPTAGVALLLITGPGRDWRAIAIHPLSLVVGGGIIAMEATYYILLEHISPTDGSLLVRLNVPVGMGVGLVLLGRRPTRLSLIGAVIVTAAIAVYLPTIDANQRWIGVALALLCAVIMSTRTFATEFHPWNRNADTVLEKMRVTGIVLLVTSLIGSALVVGYMLLVACGVVSSIGWLPAPRHLLHMPTLLLGVFVGGLIITAVQYLSFSTVVKIRTENFLATTALIPPVTLMTQVAAVEAGLIAAVDIDWRTLPAIIAVMAGVILVVWGGRRLAP